MRIEWTEVAIDDLRAIRDYIARDSRFYAARFVDRLLEATDVLVQFPDLGRHVPEAGPRTDIRELIFRSYRIIYLSRPDAVFVLTVLHGNRDLSQLTPKPWDIA